MQLSRKARRQVLVGGGVLIAGVASWWQFGRARVVRTTEVKMKNAEFHPRNIRISPGDTVTWTNAEKGKTAMGHRIRNASDNWSMDAFIEPDEEASHTFEEEGVYDVYCQIHGSPDLSGSSMKIGVGTAIEKPLGGWF